MCEEIRTNLKLRDKINRCELPPELHLQLMGDLMDSLVCPGLPEPELSLRLLPEDGAVVGVARLQLHGLDTSHQLSAREVRSTVFSIFVQIFRGKT